jgi:hypothetical protein
MRSRMGGVTRGAQRPAISGALIRTTVGNHQNDANCRRAANHGGRGLVLLSNNFTDITDRHPVAVPTQQAHASGEHRIRPQPAQPRVLRKPGSTGDDKRVGPSDAPRCSSQVFGR